MTRQNRRLVLRYSSNANDGDQVGLQYCWAREDR